jgi:hypothetical protein
MGRKTDKKFISEKFGWGVLANGDITDRDAAGADRSLAD